jgi:hypothetical protein
MPRSHLIAAAAVSLLAACATGPSATGPMSFFVTSAGMGDGANLGGLTGADAHCQRLAGAAGAGNRSWRAYLSTSAVAAAGAAAAQPAVHARDRIGKGPWYNAKGVMVARDVGHLHNGNNLNKATALSEKGEPIKGRGDTPNMHDVLTGSRVDGTAFSPLTDTTCGNWTKNGDGSAIVGHHDRLGLVPDAWALSWNFSHPSRGCSQDALKSTGGAGMFYCFAAD